MRYDVRQTISPLSKCSASIKEFEFLQDAFDFMVECSAFDFFNDTETFAIDSDTGDFPVINN